MAFIGYVAYMILNPVSPKETIIYSSEISDLEVVYSRPYKKDRLIFGSEEDGALVPFGKYWRTGANAATTFETSNGISFNDQKLEPGKYRLETGPGKEEWKVVLNSEGDKFFAISEPDYSKDILETFTSSKSIEETEQFSINFSTDSTGVSMNMFWDKTGVSISIK